VGVTGLGYDRGVRIPSPVGCVGDIGEVKPLGGVFLPTLRGTVGLIRSSCMSMSRGLSATAPVSATRTPSLMEAASVFGAFWFDLSEVGDSVFRGTCSGLVAGWYFNGGAICERPVARLQGSCFAVSTGGGRAPNRPTRSEKLTFLFSGPDTET
jgi:hypothetical protein